MLQACATAKHRDERLTENLEKQNAVLDAAQADRTNAEVKAELDKSEVLRAAEDRLLSAIGAVKKANETVIAKLKPKAKKECPNVEDEGDSDGEQ